jgi:hypothetical protein
LSVDPTATTDEMQAGESRLYLSLSLPVAATVTTPAFRSSSTVVVRVPNCASHFEPYRSSVPRLRLTAANLTPVAGFNAFM